MDRREFCLAGAVMATSIAGAWALPGSPILLDVVIFDSPFLNEPEEYLARNTPSN
jgi:hypothetical protein